MLSSLFAALAGPLVDGLLGRVIGLVQNYQSKQLTEAQLRTELEKALVSAAAEVEKQHAETLAKSYSAFLATTRQSPLLQRAFAAVIYSQLAVLLWHQLGIPAYVAIIGRAYPSSGTTVEWAYLLLAACLGLGSVVLRAGPARRTIAASETTAPPAARRP